MDDTQRRLVRRETRIASVLCSLLPTLAVFFLFEPYPVPLLGAGGLVGFALKSTAMAVLLMTLLMTLGTRAQVARGRLLPLTGRRTGVLALAPRALWLRAPVFALGAALLAAAATAVLWDLLAWGALDRPGFTAYNLVLGALIGRLATPLIQHAALADAQPDNTRETHHALPQQPV